MHPNLFGRQLSGHCGAGDEDEDEEARSSLGNCPQHMRYTAHRQGLGAPRDGGPVGEPILSCVAKYAIPLFTQDLVHVAVQ